MELLSLHSRSASTQLPSTSWRRAVTEKPAASFLAQTLIFPRKTKKNSDFTNPGYFHFSPRASGSTQVSGPGPRMEETNKQEKGSNDKDLAFVAGATGRVGSRAVRELLRIGFRVRAGVRNVQKAEALVQSVQQIELDDETKSGNSTPAVEKLEIVQCDLENKSTIGPAIGNASVVICCIGASEKEVFDVTGPYRIDYKASVNLIEAATIVKVDHFILLTSLGTNKIGFPASILNLFWGVLCWKRKAEEALIASGLPYTIVRPGGMERPTDSYKETHNIVLANEDTYFGGQVSNLQVAELMAFMAKHRKVSFCKVVEVIAETTAPLTPLEELLAKIPSQREVPEEPERDPVPPSIQLEPTISVAEKVPAQMEAPKPRSLSPYAAYDDLKPPTSPTPIPSSARKDINGPVFTRSQLGSSTSDVAPGTTPINENENELSQSSSPQSPYTAYDDLKPPTSSSPNDPTGSCISIGAGYLSSTTNSKNVSESPNPEVPFEGHTKQEHTRSLLPFAMYDELKPPTSPSPSAPTGSITSISAGDLSSTANSTNVSETSNPDEPYEGHTKQEHTRPLSPFTMYEDLKPPSSPVPSVPKY